MCSIRFLLSDTKIIAQILLVRKMASSMANVRFLNRRLSGIVGPISDSLRTFVKENNLTYFQENWLEFNLNIYVKFINKIILKNVSSFIKIVIFTKPNTCSFPSATTPIVFQSQKARLTYSDKQIWKSKRSLDHTFFFKFKLDPLQGRKRRQWIHKKSCIKKETFVDFRVIKLYSSFYSDESQKIFEAHFK